MHLEASLPHFDSVGQDGPTNLNLKPTVEMLTCEETWQSIAWSAMCSAQCYHDPHCNVSYLVT